MQSVLLSSVQDVCVCLCVADCHIVILEDQSISRCHAELVVSSTDTNREETPSSVLLRDLSKFGTLVNGCKLEKNSEVSLKSRDEIKFGSTQSSKVFEYVLEAVL